MGHHPARVQVVHGDDRKTRVFEECFLKVLNMSKHKWGQHFYRIAYWKEISQTSFPRSLCECDVAQI